MPKYTWLLLFPLLLLLITGAKPVASEDERLHQLLQDFVKKYRQLNIPDHGLSYVENLRNIRPAHDLKKQLTFFQQQARLAEKVQKEKLSPQSYLNYKHWLYELTLNQERVQLEQQFLATNSAVTDAGLLYQPLGKEWYRYFLKEYLSLNVSPEELKQFGMQEVEKVRGQMREVQKQLGYEHDSAGFYAYLQQPKFTVTSQAGVLRRYREQYQTVQQNLPNQFTLANPAEMAFAPIPDSDENSPPGIYSRESKTFYFNFYQNRHNTRAIDFLLLHEGVPGHHYQSNLSTAQTTQNPLSGLFWYMTYSEGWAAYCEELGSDLGLYQTPEAWYGKLEWDLVRSARVVMDVGLNYDGWTKEQALAFWKQHIPGQDHIAGREINRMLRWPVQVHSYKVGAATILKLRHGAEKAQGASFDPRRFHDWFLNSGPLPLEILADTSTIGQAGSSTF